MGEVRATYQQDSGPRIHRSSTFRPIPRQRSTRCPLRQFPHGRPGRGSLQTTNSRCPPFTQSQHLCGRVHHLSCQTPSLSSSRSSRGRCISTPTQSSTSIVQATRPWTPHEARISATSRTNSMLEIISSSSAQAVPRTMVTRPRTERWYVRSVDSPSTLKGVLN